MCRNKNEIKIWINWEFAKSADDPHGNSTSSGKSTPPSCMSMSAGFRWSVFVEGVLTANWPVLKCSASSAPSPSAVTAWIVKIYFVSFRKIEISFSVKLKYFNFRELEIFQLPWTWNISFSVKLKYFISVKLKHFIFREIERFHFPWNWNLFHIREFEISFIFREIVFHEFEIFHFPWTWNIYVSVKLKYFAVKLKYF